MSPVLLPVIYDDQVAQAVICSNCFHSNPIFSVRHLLRVIEELQWAWLMVSTPTTCFCSDLCIPVFFNVSKMNHLLPMCAHLALTIVVCSVHHALYYTVPKPKLNVEMEDGFSVFILSN